MSSFSRFALGAALGCALLSLPAHAASKRPRMVVLGIKSVEPSTKAAADSLTEVLTRDLAALKRFEVLGETELGSLIGYDRQRQLLGCKDESCMAELAGAFGAEFLLLGHLGLVGKTYTLDLKVADVKKSQIAGRDGALVANLDELIGAGRQVLVRALNQMPGSEPLPVPEPTAAVSHSAESRSSSAPWIVAGVGGAALLGGGLLTGLTVAGKSNLTYPQADARASAGVILAGAGLATLAAGLIWGAVSPSSPASASPSVTLGLTPGGASLVAAGSF